MERIWGKDVVIWRTKSNLRAHEVTTPTADFGSKAVSKKLLFGCAPGFLRYAVGKTGLSAKKLRRKGKRSGIEIRKNLGLNLGVCQKMPKLVWGNCNKKQCRYTMITIEFEEPNISVCKCCGQANTNGTRFVYQDDDAFAVYYIQFTKGHSEKIATGIISIGDWGTDNEPKNRVAFPFKIWTKEQNYQVGLIDKVDSPWQHKLLGTILDRNTALKHPWIKDVFHITDHIVSEDKIVIQYFTEEKDK